MPMCRGNAPNLCRCARSSTTWWTRTSWPRRRSPTLKYSMLFSPTEKANVMNIYLDNFENWRRIRPGVTTVTALSFGIKHSLFQDYLLMDTVYPAIAMVIVHTSHVRLHQVHVHHPDDDVCLPSFFDRVLFSLPRGV